MGLASGIAVAAGGWAWKNCLEEKANALKLQCNQQKVDSEEEED
jgi:hypothetical protein